MLGDIMQHVLLRPEVLIMIIALYFDRQEKHSLCQGIIISICYLPGKMPNLQASCSKLATQTTPPKVEPTTSTGWKQCYKN